MWYLEKYITDSYLGKHLTDYISFYNSGLFTLSLGSPFSPSSSVHLLPWPFIPLCPGLLIEIFFPYDLELFKSLFIFSCSPRSHANGLSHTLKRNPASCLNKKPYLWCKLCYFLIIQKQHNIVFFSFLPLTFFLISVTIGSI